MTPPSFTAALEHLGGVVLGVAGVDDERQPGLPRRLDMRLEPLALRRAVGLVVKIIEAALADRDDARVVGRLDQRCGAEVRMGIGLVRVDADARPDVRLALGDGDDVAPFALAGRDVEEAGDAAFAGVLKHFGLTFDEAFVVEVAMAIDQPHRRLFLGLREARAAGRAASAAQDGSRFRRAANTNGS